MKSRLRATLFNILPVVFLFGVVDTSFGEEPFKDAWYYRERAEEARDRAETAREQKDAEAERKAIDEQLENLNEYVKQSPDDLDERERYAMLLAENARDAESYAKAFALLEKVVEQDPDRESARKLLVGYYLLPGIHRFNDARMHLDAMLKKKPDDAESLYHLGHCLIEMGKSEEAVAVLQKAVEISPETVDAYWFLATTLRQTLSKPDEADAWMDKMIAANEKSALAHRYMCRYLLSIKSDSDPKDAQRHADAALKLEPGHRETLALQAVCCSLNKDYAAARRFADKALENEKDDLAYRRRMYLILADVENQSKNGKRAVAILEKAYGETKDPELLFTMADWQLSGLDANGAAATIEKLKSLEYPDEGLDYLRGKMLIMRSKWREGCEALERARPFCLESPDRNCRLEFFLGLGYGNLGNADKQIEAFRRALEIDPQFAAARQALSEALRNAGKKEDALREAAAAAKMSRDSDSAFALAGLQLEKQRRRPKEERRWEEIEKMLDDAGRDFPGEFRFELLRCDLLIAKGRIEEAEEFLRKLADKEPKNPVYWEVLANFSIFRRQWNRAEETLARFEKAAGDCAELRLAKARYFSLRYGPQAGARLGPLRENIDRFDESQKILLWAGMLDIALTRGDRIEADNLMRLLVEKSPDDLKLQMLRFEQANDDPPTMERILADIERIEGKGPTWLYAKAYLIDRRFSGNGDKAELDGALELLGQAKELRPSWPKIPLLAGRIHDRKGETGEALKNYLEAIDLGETNLAYVRRAVQLLYERQRFQEADDLLDRLERGEMPLASANDLKPVLLKNLFQWRINTLVERGKYEEAARKAREIAELDSKNYREPLWLGRVMWDIARRMKATGREKESAPYEAEAEKNLRLAAEWGGQSPDPWATLVHFLASVDRMPDAERALEEAKQHFAGREPLALAQCYEATKNAPLAEKQFEAALEARPNDPNVAMTAAKFFYRNGNKNRAESLLSRILEKGSLKDDSPESMESRRMLAILLASRKGYENTSRARELIAKNLAADPHSAIDNRMLADCDARDPEHGRRREAIEALAKLHKNGQASLDERWNLAKLYLADKQWKNARETYRMLVAAAPDRLEFAVGFALALLDHNELAEAEPILRLFEEKHPKSVQAAALKAEMLLRRGKADEAIELLKRFVEDSASTPADRGERMKLAASFIENFIVRAKPSEKIAKERLLPAAEAYWQQLMGIRPEAVIDLILYYARQKQLDDAAALLEKSWQSLHPATLGQVCDKIAQESRDSKPTVDRVIAVLDKGRTHFRHHPALVLALGNIHSGRGEYDAAEECFRDVLRANPRDAAAMNNLASTLAAAKRNLDEALELIEKAMKITGPLPAMLDTRACIRIARGEGEKAVADMADVVADAKTSERLFHQAQAYETAGDKTKAGKSMKEAIEKGLSRETLSAGEIPIFDRLKKLADDLPPEPEDDGPSFFNDYA